MCDPVSATLAGATLMQGIAADQAGGANARAYNQQAKVLDQSARQTELQGLRDEEAVRSNVRRFAGAQRAAFAANGIVGNEGSAAKIEDDTARQGEIDALTARNNAYLEAWGIRTNATTARNQARIERAQGRNTLLTSAISASAFAAGAFKPASTSTASATVNGPSGPITNTATLSYR